MSLGGVVIVLLATVMGLAILSKFWFLLATLGSHKKGKMCQEWVRLTTGPLKHPLLVTARDYTQGWMNLCSDPVWQFLCYILYIPRFISLP